MNEVAMQEPRFFRVSKYFLWVDFLEWLDQALPESDARLMQRAKMIALANMHLLCGNQVTDMFAVREANKTNLTRENKKKMNALINKTLITKHQHNTLIESLMMQIQILDLTIQQQLPADYIRALQAERFYFSVAVVAASALEPRWPFHASTNHVDMILPLCKQFFFLKEGAKNKASDEELYELMKDASNKLIDCWQNTSKNRK